MPRAPGAPLPVRRIVPSMQVHLVDGTYELFRHHFAVPSHLDDDGMEVAAVRGVMGSVLMMLEQGATHVGVATDHVIESFRNELWPGLQDERGHAARAAGAVPAARGRPARPRRGRLADGRARSRRRAGVGGRRRPRRTRGWSGCSSARPTRTSASAWRTRVVVQLDRRREGTVIDEAGGAGQVRRGARLDPRLPRAGRRLRRRLPRPARLGREVGRRRARPLRAPRGDPRRRARRGTSTCAARPSSRRHWPTARDAAELFLDLATLRTNGDVGVVDDWEWRGARARARGVGRAARRRDARRPRRAVWPRRGASTMEMLDAEGGRLHVHRAWPTGRPTASSCCSCTGSRRRRTSGASRCRCSRPPATARLRPTSAATRPGRARERRRLQDRRARRRTRSGSPTHSASTASTSSATTGAARSRGSSAGGTATASAPSRSCPLRIRRRSRIRSRDGEQREKSAYMLDVPRSERGGLVSRQRR